MRPPKGPHGLQHRSGALGARTDLGHHRIGRLGSDELPEEREVDRGVRADRRRDRVELEAELERLGGGLDELRVHIHRGGRGRTGGLTGDDVEPGGVATVLGAGERTDAVLAGHVVLREVLGRLPEDVRHGTRTPLGLGRVTGLLEAVGVEADGRPRGLRTGAGAHDLELDLGVDGAREGDEGDEDGIHELLRGAQTWTL